MAGGLTAIESRQPFIQMCCNGTQVPSVQAHENLHFPSSVHIDFCSEMLYYWLATSKGVPIQEALQVLM